MYLYGVPLLLLQVALALHAYKYQSLRWVLINLAVPLFGSLAYVLICVLPSAVAWLQDRAQRPSHTPRAALRSQELSIEQSLRWADDALRDGRNDQAIPVYENALRRGHREDPNVLLSLSRAYFARRRFVEARDTIDQLKRVAPFSVSGETHLLYARTMEELNNTNAALGEYEALCRYYDGAEAKYRYGLLLKRLGYGERARQIFDRIVDDAKVSKPAYRMTQRRWLDLAMQESLHIQ